MNSISHLNPPVKIKTSEIWYPLNDTARYRRARKRFTPTRETRKSEDVSKHTHATADLVPSDNPRVQEILNLAADRFQENLKRYPQAKAYYHRRGIKDETISRCGLGYAGGSRRGLYNHLYQSGNYTEADLLASGLFYKSETTGGLSDAFRNRYMIPYFRNARDVCYFIGREATGTFEDSKKYIKQRLKDTDDAVDNVLWGAGSIGTEKPILIPEGIIDAVLLWQELGERYDVVSPATTQLNATDRAKVVKMLLSAGVGRALIFVPDAEVNDAGLIGAKRDCERLFDDVSKALVKKARGAGIRSDKIKQWVSERMPVLKIAKLERGEQEKIDAANYIEAGRVDELRACVENAKRFEREIRINNPSQAKNIRKHDPSDFDDLPFDRKALDFIDPDDSYDLWVRVGMACKTAGLFDVWDAWSARGAKYDASVMQAKWDSFRSGDVTWGTVVYEAKLRGYEPSQEFKATQRNATQKKRKSRRLQRVSETSLERNGARLDDVRAKLLKITEDILRGIVEGGAGLKRVFFIDGKVGTGKTYAILKALSQSDLKGIYTCNNAEMRNEKATEAAAIFGSGVLNWHGRQQGFDKIKERPIEARERNEALFSEGVLCPMYDWHDTARRAGIRNPCDLCDLRAACVSDGYLSQYSALKKAGVVCLSLPDALADGLCNFQGVLSERLGETVLHIIDDYTIDDLILTHTLTKAELRKAIDCKAGVWHIDKNGLSDDGLQEWEAVRFAQGFLEKVLDVWGDFASLQALINETRVMAQEIKTGVSLVVFRGEIMTGEQAYLNGMPITDLQVFDAEWYERLSQWVSEHEPDSVIFDVDFQKWAWNAKPTLTGIKNLALLSGTTDGELAKQMIPEGIEIHDEFKIDTPRLPDNVTVLQFRDAKYTTESIFDFENGESVGITPGASAYINELCRRVQYEKKRGGYRACFISHKEFCLDREGNPHNAAVYHSPEAALIRETFDETLHYHTAQGRNLDVQIVVCFGYPRASHQSVQEKVSLAFQKRIPEDYNDATAFLEITENGIKNAGRIYKDKDARRVWQNETRGLLVQAVGRVRPYTPGDCEKFVIIHTNERTEFTQHAELYTKADLQQAGGFSDISRIVSEREQAEQAGDVQAVMKTAGVGKSTAYNRTQSTRNATQADLKRKAKQMRAEGLSYRAIAKRLQKAPNTIKKWCEA